MLKIMENYQKAKLALFEHVGFNPDWVEFAIDDATEMWWGIRDSEVCYAEKQEDLFTGDGYSCEIYAQRFYKKHVYVGESLTMIFCDPQVDGCPWLRFFDKSKQIALPV